jgi:uncharacterized protein YkwD
MLHAMVLTRRFVLLVAFAFAGFATPLHAADAVWQAEIIFQINSVRAGHGLAPLQWSDRLGAAAASHAADLQRCGRLAHEGCNGSSLPQRLDRAGYRLRRAAENLALCACDAAGVVRLWLDSDGHRRNLLDPDVTEMGVETRVDSGDLRRALWVLVVGRE